MDLVTLFTGVIVPIVAILAFGLSVYNAYIQWKQDRPNIALDISYEKYTFDDPTCDEIIPYDCYAINAKNHGHADLIVATVGFKWNNMIFERDYSSIINKGGYSQYKGLPFRLTPGEKLFVEIFRREIITEILKSGIKGTIKVTCFIKDGNGIFYPATPIEIDTEISN
jgi:hypothetical protein